MPRASTQNARPALRRLPTRPSRRVQAVVSRLLPLLFRSQGLELSLLMRQRAWPGPLQPSSLGPAIC